MTARVLFHVQHLLGSGHLRRAAAIAAELARQGFAVELVSGGMPIADLDLGRARLIQLPPVRALDATFRTLVDEHGRPIDDTWKTARRELLLEQLRRFRPDVLVTELFPFGRGALAFEFVPLLEAAHELSLRPLILSSIRDVLVQKSDPRKVELAIERVRSWYDRVLVHGDPELIPLSATFPEHRLTDKLVYTGYVDGDGSPDVRQTDDGVNEVIVSVGGGAVGAGLLRMAIAAIPLSKLGNRRWRLLVGSHLDALARDALMREAGASCVIADDAHQTYSLGRTLSLLVVDAAYGFGNRRLLPAGPLREPISEGLARSDAVILIGSGNTALPDLGALPLFHAELVPNAEDAARLRGERVLAFAGIARPDKFFASLQQVGAEIVSRVSFADHAHYDADTIMRLVEDAHRQNATPVTTAKDLARFPSEAKAMVETLRVALRFADPAAFETFLRTRLHV